MKRIAAVGMVAVLGLGAVACSSSKDDATTESTESEALTATTPPSTTTTTTPSAAALADLLLTSAEVGPEWTISPTSGTDEGDSSDLPDCLQGLDELSPERTDAEVEFDKANGDYFVEAIEYAGADVIESEFAAAKALFDACSAVTIDAGGTIITGTMAPIPLTTGDMSAAYELTFSANGVTLTMCLSIVGVDGYELSTAVGQVDNPDRSTFERLTEEAVAKLQAGGGQTA